MPDDVRVTPAPPKKPTDNADLASGGDPPAPSMVALGELICRINPYTRLPADQTSGLSTGNMEVEMLPAAQQGYVAANPNSTIACMGIEVERGYKPTWTFKGQEQSVTAAARIPYRFPVYKNGELVYWQTEFLLIGFVGGGGMG
jgi:hypothetical protein